MVTDRPGGSQVLRELIAVMGLLVAGPVAALDVDAGAALDQAFSRQQALPGYVEHLYGRMPVLPGMLDQAAKTIEDGLKDKARERVQQKIAIATAKLPIVNEVAERAMAQLDDQADAELVVTFGPEEELGTIEYAGARRHEVFPGSRTEIVRADGRTAMKLDLGTQIAELTLAAAMTGEGLVGEVRSVRSSLKALTSHLAHGGFTLVGQASELFDSLSQLLSTARSTAQILQIAASMSKLSGQWQCQADAASGSYAGTRVAVRRLADETLADGPAHVYEEVRAFSFPAAPAFGSRRGGLEPPTAFELQYRVWVRDADGLPVRTEFATPGGMSQRIEFAYPAAVDVALPVCMSP
jgi:hypothetical protein